MGGIVLGGCDMGCLGAVGLMVVLSVADSGQGPAKRNVLLIIADDLGRESAGCYGGSGGQTPHLDALARDGVRFTRAYATTASCSPSRSVLYTGMHNHANGQYGLAHADHHFAQFDRLPTAFSIFQRAGYRTGLIGKKHVQPETNYPVDFERPGAGRDPRKFGRFAREFLNGAEPFFLVIGFVDPHRAGQGFANPPDPPAKPGPRAPLPAFLPELPAARADWHDYQRSVARMDESLGAVLAALRESGRQEQTLVIFLSDNGPPFPGAKTTLYEPGVHLPLLVLAPNQRQRGIDNQLLVSWVDILPTLLEWAGVAHPAPRTLHGRSFLRWLETPRDPNWEEIYFSHTFHEVTMYYPMRGIRSGKYKLIWNLASPLPFPFASDLQGSATWQAVLQNQVKQFGPRTTHAYLHRPPWELYDIEADPLEARNLIDDPAVGEVRAQLQRKLRQFQESTRDPWAVKYRY